MVSNGPHPSLPMLALSLHRCPWRQEQLPTIFVPWAENIEQTFSITSSRG